MYSRYVIFMDGWDLRQLNTQLEARGTILGKFFSHKCQCDRLDQANG